MRHLTDIAMLVAAAGLVLAVTVWPARPETIAGHRITVIDGDTISLPAVSGRRSEHIRLLDIDAPEAHRPRCPVEQIAAQAATDKLAALLAGRPVSIERHGRDRYGRTLARLRTPVGDVGAAMMAAGLALPWRPGREAWQRRADYWCKETP